jgi:hypothetical protein
MSLPIETFVYNLKLSPNLNPGGLTEIHFKVLSNLAKALIFIIPSLWIIYTIYNDTFDKSTTFDEYQDKVIETKKTSNFIKIAQGLLFILLAFRLYFLYKPTNSEISLAILIKYLKKKNILDKEIYGFLKNFKPHRIESYV